MALIYISAPYTHPDISMIDSRMARVTKFSAFCLQQGKHIVCPLTMGHAFIGKQTLPLLQDFWMDWCYALLSKCDVMYVLQIPGWEISNGVQKEIQYCKDNDIPIEYITQEFVESLLSLNGESQK